MSSLLTNNSAMVALQTLKTINRDMGDVQNQISTGKKIATARDNAALWGIATTMETDVSGFRAISESLSLGTATLTVGRDAAEMVAGLLDQLKGKIVAAQEENVDRSKIEADVVELRKQIKGVVAGAQFNGLNLLSGTDEISILGSLVRNEDGSVVPNHITFNQHDLTTNTGGLDTVNGGTVTGVAISGGDSTVTVGAAQLNVAFAGANLTTTESGTIDFTINGETFTTASVTGTAGDDSGVIAAAVRTALLDTANATKLAAAGIAPADIGALSTNAFTIDTGFGITMGAMAVNTGLGSGITQPTSVLTGQTLTARAETVQITAAAAGAILDGSGYEVTLGTGGTAQTFLYVANNGDTGADVTAGLAAAINASADITGVSTRVTTDGSGNELLQIDYDGTDTNFGATSVAVAVDSSTVATANGELIALETLSVADAESAAQALQDIEPMIQSAIDAAAAFGSSQGRIDTQTEFVSKIMDGLTSGIGALVDADMEAASARLQALQVQQQLGIQALSIANQTPQNILALFRQ